MLIRTFPSILNFAHPTWAPEDDAGADNAPEEPRTTGSSDDEAGAVEPESETDQEPEAEAEETSEPEASAEGNAEPEEDDAPKPKKDWREKRLAKATAARAEAEARAKAAEERAAALEALMSKPESERTEDDAALLAKAEQRVESRLRQETYFKRLNEAADNMFDAGAKAFPDTWNERVKEVAEIYGKEIANRPDFLEAVTDLDNGAAVYHELADDPDQLESLLKMSPVKMGVELAKLSAKLATPKPKPISKAPAPIKPLEKPGDVPTDLENAEMDIFAAIREKQFGAYMAKQR